MFITLINVDIDMLTPKQACSNVYDMFYIRCCLFSPRPYVERTRDLSD